MDKKYCPRCKETKLILDFYIYRGRPDSLHYWCKKCVNQYNRNYRKTHKDSYNAWRKQRREKYKLDTLTYYGKGKPVCVRCGFDDIRALSIDHIDNGGGQHRLGVGRYGSGFYPWLEREGYPEGYQTLCMNCQFIKKEEMGESIAR